jgi:hypothetical protein
MEAMPEVSSSTARESNSLSATLRQEWMVIAICSALAIAVEFVNCISDPVAVRRDKTTLLSIVGALLWWFGHALWLTMDRRRRGLEVGRWRYGVIFFGPLAIWLYLVLEYRVRALYLIPLSLAIYAVITLACAVARVIALHTV